MLFQIEYVSKACHSLCLWVHAMYNYYFVNLKVKPKMEALAKAELALAETEQTLNMAIQRLREVEEGVEQLRKLLREEEERKAELEREKQLCEDRMGRAVRLIDGLAGEQIRWTTTVLELNTSLKNAVGDILLASGTNAFFSFSFLYFLFLSSFFPFFRSFARKPSPEGSSLFRKTRNLYFSSIDVAPCASTFLIVITGAIAYLTPFTDAYRQTLLSSWKKVLGEGVPHTLGSDPVSTLGDQVEIRRWQIEGLPRDTLSVENAVLAMHSNRWPLFIDPQAQANKWIRSMVSKRYRIYRGIVVSNMVDDRIKATTLYGRIVQRQRDIGGKNEGQRAASRGRVLRAIWKSLSGGERRPRAGGRIRPDSLEIVVRAWRSMVRQSWREYRSLQSGFPALPHHQTLESALHARSMRENTAGQLCAHRHVSRTESFANNAILFRK